MKEKRKAEELAAENLIGCGEEIFGSGIPEKKKAKPELLLHSCCGPCSTAVIERLLEEFNVTVFFYNPCITDEDEYRRRRESQLKVIEKFNEQRMTAMVDAGEIRFREGPYEPGAFFTVCKGHEGDPEGGDRCGLCFRQRLEKTAQTASLAGYDCFATTLTVSPHKNYSKISAIGNEIGLKYGVSFCDRDFKKRDGFKRSIELSKKFGLYRQDYCGCEYSKRNGQD